VIGLTFLASGHRGLRILTPTLGARLSVAGVIALGLAAPQLLTTLAWAPATPRPLSGLEDTQIMPYWAPPLGARMAWEVLRQTVVAWSGVPSLYLSVPVVAFALVGFVRWGGAGAVLGSATIV